MYKSNLDQKLDLITFLETEHKKLIRAVDAARMLGISQETVYDWKYRAKMKDIPEDMFVKVSKMLFLRSDLLKMWILRKVN